MGRSLARAEDAGEVDIKERFQQLIEHSGDAFFLHDRAGRILEANQQACDSLGYTREELLNLWIQDIVPEYKPSDPNEWGDGVYPGIKITSEGVHRRKDGTSFPVEVRIGAFESGGRKLVLALCRDVTERRQVEDETRRRAAELAIINDINEALGSQLELQAMITRVVEKIRQALDVQSAYLALYDRDANQLQIPCIVEADRRVAIDPFPFGTGWTSTIIQRRQALLINQDAERRAAELGAVIAGIPAKSYLGVPIIVGDDALGVIAIQDTEREGLFGEAETRLLSTIAPSVGIAIQNARLLEQARQRAAYLTTLSQIQAAISQARTEDDIVLAFVRGFDSSSIRSLTLAYLEPDADDNPYTAYSVAVWLDGVLRPDDPFLYRRYDTRSLALAKIWKDHPDEVVLVSDLQTDPRVSAEARGLADEYSAGGAAILPLRSGGRWHGLVWLLWKEAHAFTEEERFLLRQMLEPTAAAVASRRADLAQQQALAETHRLARRSQLINQIAAKMRAAVSVDEVLRIATDELRQATNSTRSVARLSAPGRTAGESSLGSGWQQETTARAGVADE